VGWLACTAWLTLMLIDDHGVPLKHGRTRRLFTLAQRLGEAFEEWLSRQNPDDLPDHGGLPATLLITTPATSSPQTSRETGTQQPADTETETTTTGGGAGTTAAGARVSARAMGWLACTAWLTLMLIDDHGVPLKHGRTKRLFSLGQRLGFAVRDKGCVFPGCDRPPPGARRITSAPGAAAGPPT
jgi:hypothetical protein